MDDPFLLRLYPLPALERPLVGTYLGHDLRARACAERPFVYSNFIASLDGRIAWVNPGSGLREVPPALANPTDLRLFLELAAQADCLVTTTRHLRAVAAGRHDALLTPGAHPDLAAWRRERGLPEQPMVVAVGRRPGFEAAALRAHYAGPLTVMVDRVAPGEAEAITGQGAELLLREGPLTGAALVAALSLRGYRVIYSIAGPRLLRLLLDAGRLDRLYLTQPALLIGGGEVDTLGVAPLLEPPVALPLREAWLDRGQPAGAGQLLLVHGSR